MDRFETHICEYCGLMFDSKRLYSSHRSTSGCEIVYKRLTEVESKLAAQENKINNLLSVVGSILSNSIEDMNRDASLLTKLDLSNTSSTAGGRSSSSSSNGAGFVTASPSHVPAPGAPKLPIRKSPLGDRSTLTANAMARASALIMSHAIGHADASEDTTTNAVEGTPTSAASIAAAKLKAKKARKVAKALRPPKSMKKRRALAATAHFIKLIKLAEVQRRDERGARMRSIENVIGISPNRAMLTGFSSSSSSGSNRLAGGAANGFEDVSVVINELSAYDDDDLEGKIGVLNKFMEYSATEKAKCTLLLDSGAKDLFLKWLAVQVEQLHLLANREELISPDVVSMLHLLVQIIAQATWTPEAVKTSRYDRRVRHIYKELSSYLEYHAPAGDDGPGAYILSGGDQLQLHPVRALVAFLKERWGDYRLLLRQAEDARLSQPSSVTGGPQPGAGTAVVGVRRERSDSSTVTVSPPNLDVPTAYFDI